MHKFSIALFPAERAQRACSHTCTGYIPFTFTNISLLGGGGDSSVVRAPDS